MEHPARPCINQSDDRFWPAFVNYFRIRGYIVRPAGRLIDKVNFDGTSIVQLRNFSAEVYGQSFENNVREKGY